MQSNRHIAGGYTIVELMIVILIISVITVIAVPTYQNYAIRAKIAECIELAAAAKFQISEYRLTMGVWPPSAEDAALVGSGMTDLCLGYDYEPANGAFAILVNSAAIAPDLGPVAPLMIPTINNSFITWNCTSNVGAGTAAESVTLLPSTCRDSAE